MIIHRNNSQAILLVEDSEDDYESTIRAFQKANLHNTVYWCKSGKETLDFLNREGEFKDTNHARPGMILLDLNMPGMDGRRTLQLIKESPELRSIPVIILTTSGDQRDVDRCYEMGANSYVQKPVSFDGLIESIKRLKEYWFEIVLFPKGGNHDE